MQVQQSIEDTLTVENLSITYSTVYGTLRALNDVNLSIARGESVAIVGESGCGKSTLGLAVVRLLPLNAIYAAGSITLDGRDIIGMSDSQMNRTRGKSAFMIFQDPLNTLNPVKRVDIQMLEAIKSRNKNEGRPFDETSAREEVVKALADVRMPDPEIIATRFPHELSGGQIQRVVISMGLLMRPKLMIADEPTSALDVTIQAQVLKLLRDLQHEYGMSIIFITHDINIAYTISDRMVVMYAGEVVESAPSTDLVRHSLHPYSQALVSSIPRTTKRQGMLTAISGSPPDMLEPPTGCRFNPRCPHVMDICRTTSPPQISKEKDVVKCFLYDNKHS
jgi:peptide/nickel transport system ATP-binding protein